MGFIKTEDTINIKRAQIYILIRINLNEYGPEPGDRYLSRRCIKYFTSLEILKSYYDDMIKDINRNCVKISDDYGGEYLDRRGYKFAFTIESREIDTCYKEQTWVENIPIKSIKDM